MTEKDYLTTKEAADYLKINPNYLYILVSKGKVPVNKPLGKLYFSKADLDLFLSKKKEAKS